MIFSLSWSAAGVRRPLLWGNHMMLMKRSALFLVMATAGFSAAPSFADTFNGKLASMGSTGIASIDFKNASIVNPALLTRYGKSDDVAVTFNAGGMVSDQDDLIDHATDLSDLVDTIDGRFIDESTVRTIFGHLEALEGAKAYAKAGASLQVAIPTDYASLAFFANTQVELSAGVELNYNDVGRVISAHVVGDAFDESQLESQVYALGVRVDEYGISIARSFDVKGRSLSIGVSPKIQNVETIEYITSVVNFDKEDFDANQYTNDATHFNVDLGLHYAVTDQLTIGATAKNLVKKDYKTVSGRTVSIDPQATVGVAYSLGWVTAEANLDLHPVTDMTGLGENQFARVGVELSAFDWAQVRVGYVHDLKGTREDVVTAGLGFAPFGVVNLDLSALYGENKTYGAAIQLGIHF